MSQTPDWDQAPAPQFCKNNITLLNVPYTWSRLSYTGSVAEALPFSSALVCWGSLAHPEVKGRCWLQLCGLLPCLAGAGVSSDASCCRSCLPVQCWTWAPSIPRFGCSTGKPWHAGTWCSSVNTHCPWPHCLAHAWKLTAPARLQSK